MRIVVVGQGYVGSTLTAWFGCAGHDVIGVDSDQRRLHALMTGRGPVFEPGLDERLGPLVAGGTVSFVRDYSEVTDVPSAVVVAVNTPAAASGQADLSQVVAALSCVSEKPLPGAVVLRSTVPPGTCSDLVERFPMLRNRFAYVPDFFRQGHAFEDLDRPSRVVIGSFSTQPLEIVERIFGVPDAPRLITDPSSAELVKYASNAYLAAKISFANEVADQCEAIGANVDDVLNGIGADRRIGRAFLQAGLGYGDSCLPKDTRGYRHWADSVGAASDIVNAALRINDRQRTRISRMLKRVAVDTGISRFRRIAVLGVRYLTSSDDFREAPSRWIVPQLSTVADSVCVWDQATSATQLEYLFPGVRIAATVDEALEGTGLAVVLGRWPELLSLNWSLVPMVTPRVVIDPTNYLKPGDVRNSGLLYYGYGRPTAGRSQEAWTA